MSHARELVFLEKWSDRAATQKAKPTAAKASKAAAIKAAATSAVVTVATALPPISPTSPKATKFCCCPNRRRYHIKQPKNVSSTFNARNIFIDNDFHYIDDVANETTSNNCRQIDTATGKETATAYDKCVPADDGIRKESDLTTTGSDTDSGHVKEHDYDYDDDDDNDHDDNERERNENLRNKECKRPQWRYDKTCPDNTTNDIINTSNNTSTSTGTGTSTGTSATTINESNENDSNNSCNWNEQSAAWTMQLATQQQQQYNAERLSTATSPIAAATTIATATATAESNNNSRNCFVRNTIECGNDRDRVAATPSTSPTTTAVKNHDIDNCNNNNNKNNNNSGDNEDKGEVKHDSNNHRSDQTIQRLSNRHPNNKQSNISNSNNNTITNTTNTSITNITSNNNGNSNVVSIDRDKVKIDLATKQRPKMTITTTTNVANRKRSELTTPATPITPTATLPMLERPTTPLSLKTVIKTTMVKRSPSCETAPKLPSASSSPSPSPTALPLALASPATPVTPTSFAGCHHKTMTTVNVFANNNNNNNNYNNDANNPSAEATPTTVQTPLTVRERIAALVAENEQTRKNYDNTNNKSKLQCNNSNSSNMTTIKVKTANGLHNANSNWQGEWPRRPTTTPQTPQTPQTPTTEVLPTDDDVPAECDLAGRNNDKKSSPVGAATMPRRRSSNALTVANNERNNKSGSNITVMTATNRDGRDVALAGERQPDRDDLAALGILDLALKLDDDPYCVLEEYLERVKHEINEVFELHKSRQRMQQKSTTATTTAADNDELSDSRESDSELDNANGGQGHTGSRSDYSSSNTNTNRNNNRSNNNDRNNKLRTRVEETRPVAEISCQRDMNGQLTTAAAAKATAATAVTAVAAMAAAAVPVSECDTNQQLQLNSAAAKRLATLVAALPAPRTINLKALSPPPFAGSPTSSDSDAAAPTTGAFPDCETAAEEVNIWANKFLRDLDNLMAGDKPRAASACSSKTSPMLLSAAASAAIKSRYGKGTPDREGITTNTSTTTTTTAATMTRATTPTPTTPNGVVLRPEKHVTIPLQSFNLDCGHIDNGNNATANVVYMRTLSAPTPYHRQIHQQCNDYISGCVAGGKNNRNSLAVFNTSISEHQQHHHHNHHHNHHNHHQQHNYQPHQQQQYDQDGMTNMQYNDAAITTTPATILKIEEIATAAAAAAALTAAATATATATAASGATSGRTPTDAHDGERELLKTKRQRQLDNDIKTMQYASASQPAALEAGNSNRSGHNGGSNSCNGSSDRNMLVASATAATIPNRERINHAMTKATSLSATLLTSSKTNGTIGGSSSQAATAATTAATTTATAPTTTSASASTTPGYLLNGNDATKKGSTSTIWTSEESILRSVGAVDEDNNSTSSSACEEASGALSSSKSGISLDSSGLDNDNNESGIGTATPPKDMSYWKSVHNDNESVSSLDALRKIKFQKSGSVASSDDPDLLEVLSLCDEPHGVDACEHRENEPSNDAVDADEDNEGHDEFETIPYCDCEYADADADTDAGNVNVGLGAGSRDGGGSGGDGGCSIGCRATAPTTNDAGSVVLRRKYVGTPIMVPYATAAGPVYGGRVQKCRSHSLETSSLSPAHQHNFHLHSQYGRKLHNHLHNRTKERGQLSLALLQEPFQSLLAPTHFHELPSPSSASLHSGHESLGIQELTTKSNSAPLLLKQEKKRNDFAGQNLTLRYSRSQSDRYLAEIEAVEACKWLRAAGFPQYAQMYEDHQFPIDLTNVAKDHTNLENDQLQSLYRRLCILNRCANMRLDQSHKAQTPQKEDSDDENFALSENWTFQRNIRRWSRIGEMGLELPGGGKLGNAEKTESSSKESSPDRFEDDAYDVTGAGLSLTLPGPGAGDSADNTLNDSTDSANVRLRRTGSERLKDGAKAFLRRVESIKSRRRKRQNREGIVISGPQALDLSQLGQRHSLRKPEAVYSTPPSPSAVSPMHTFPKSPFFGNELKVPSQSENFLSPNRASPKRTPTTPRSMRTSPLHFFSNPMPHLREGKSDDSSSYYSDSQESSTGGKLSLRKAPSKTRRLLQRTGKVDDIGAHSDSECHQGRKLLIKDANSNTTEVKIKKLTRGGSLNLGKDPKKRDGFRTASFRSRSTTRKENKSDDGDTIKKNPVVRWHSFQMEERPHMIFRKCFSQNVEENVEDPGIPFAAMSAGQLQIIRKLALVVLTGHMERYCPTHRSGWNWELPKFIKKIKMPDYKDKKVFGVPLLLILQRTGQTLPTAVRAAFRWLQLNALDQIGLFRKSGVKSRIIKLKELIEYSESTAECMDVFDAQQAYDVADMLKQYFRDLPESLLTTKMSETFAAIFQHLPPEVRLDAVQCAVLLLPDENREILHALLEFLTLVAANSQYNQMTSNNLAVCLAPSLFHNSISTGTASVSASPRRRGKGTGVPDVKELSEAKASHECLSFMIDNYKQIFTASKDKISKCNFGYMEESKPVPLEALGEGIQYHNWRGYLYECTSATIKEGREKTRGWFTIASTDSTVDIGYKKVGDGHPLRLWRCVTEVEGPPKDVLDYIVNQRASWDVNLLQSQTVKKLDEHTEIFQYALDGQISSDFCVLRSWQTDLPRGACVIVETSIEHAKAKPMFGAVRGVVLASRYLIEPCGGGRSRVMHLARVDIKGKTPEWYNKSYGHICSHYLSRIRLAFKNVADGPESKV